MADTNVKGSRGSAMGDEKRRETAHKPTREQIEQKDEETFLLNEDGHQDNFGRHETDDSHSGTRENKR
jgi:hypothetical protein